MKKSLVVILCLICISVITGCKNESKVTPVCSEISFTAEILYRNENFEYKTEITNVKDNTIKLSFTDTATNIEYTFCDNQITEELFGIKNTKDISSIPSGSVLDLLYLIFSDINKNELSVTQTDTEYFIGSENAKYNYKITFGESGIPLQISERNFGIKAIIKDAKLL